MGVELEIGCLTCKKQMWLGSQKPFKWNGFQVGDETVKRFWSLHSTNQKTGCKLLLVNDSDAFVSPWEAELDEKEKTWSEDIISRSFWDSFSIKYDGPICGHCEKSLAVDDTEKRKHGNLQKNIFLWFCDEKCVKRYTDFHAEIRDTIIYDSSNDVVLASENSIIEIGCTQCKEYFSVDYQKDKDGGIKDMEYLALFLIEHLNHDYLLSYMNDNKNSKLSPWRNDLTEHLWKEYFW